MLLFFYFFKRHESYNKNYFYEMPPKTNKKTIFYIHIPKTAGTFIENYFEKSNVMIGRFDKRITDSYKDFSCNKYHVPPKYFSSIDFNMLEPFTVIRHPISRLISEYNYLKTFEKPRKAYDFQYTDINKFVTDNLYDGNYSCDCHLIPQIDFIKDGDGNHCQTFLRFENLEHDLRWLCRSHNIDVQDMNFKRNKSIEYANENDLSKESKELILSFYQKDLDLWKRASTNVIYMYWADGFEYAPNLIDLCCLSWKMMNPTWVFIELNDKNLAKHISDMSFLLRQKPKMSLTSYSDLVRLTLLKENGGVWVDATVFCLKPLNDWLHEASPNGFFAFSHPQRQISSWFLYAHRNSIINEKWFKEMTEFWSNRNDTKKYFWVHELYRNCYRKNKDFQNNVSTMKKIDAIPLHDFQRKGIWNEKTVVQKLTLKKPLKLSYFYDFLLKKKKLKLKLENRR